MAVRQIFGRVQFGHAIERAGQLLQLGLHGPGLGRGGEYPLQLGGFVRIQLAVDPGIDEFQGSCFQHGPPFL